MNSATAIAIEGLGKRYRLGQTIDLKRTFRETIGTLPRHLARRTRAAAGEIAGRLAGGADGASAEAWADAESPPGTFWALRDVTLEIKSGEVVGLIGANGAGKSTLLKVLSRITAPTKGRALLQGRISSLLEVGTGFHQELTGRENIYLNSAILGMRKVEIDRKFDEIVDFSGVEKFIDTPVKRYSSGMYVRLAFAVAAHLESEIMLVDEVLAVGDTEFQQKCLGKMRSVASSGRTVIYVSHNMSSVRALCGSAMHLNQGRLVNYGPVDDVILNYLEGAERQGNEVVWDAATAPGNEKARVRAIRVVKEDGSPCRVTDIDSPVVIETEYEVLEAGAELNLMLSIHNREDVYILCSPSATDEQWYMKPHPVGVYRSRVTVPGKLLNKGYYFVSMYLGELGNYRVTHQLRVVGFELIDVDSKGGFYGSWHGVVRPELQWRTERTGAEASR